MGSGNNPSTKADLFSAQQPPDSPSLSTVQQKSTHTDEPVAASSQSYALPQNLPSALKEAPIHLPLGKLNAVRAAFKAGVTPSRIARQFRISLSDVKLALASGPSK